MSPMLGVFGASHQPVEVGATILVIVAGTPVIAVHEAVPDTCHLKCPAKYSPS